MHQSWSDFTVVEAAPNPDAFELLSEATWGLFYSWIAGPEWVVATRDRVEPEPVRHAHGLDDGTMEYWDEPFTAKDQAVVDDDLDSDLDAVGLPARPRGFDWYLRLTKPQRTAFREYLGDKVESGLPGSTSERDYLIHVFDVMSTLVPEAIQHAVRPD
jgi:hypothetical protein